MTAKRDTALDIVKGLCVLIMVIHHAINYFPTEAVALKYFRFVSGAFLFMAGFVATHIYSAKYDFSKEKIQVGKRLVVRGVKLIIIFLIANTAILLTIGGRLGVASMPSPKYLNTWLITGTYETQSFALLVPIAYTLIVVGVLIFFFEGRRSVIISMAALLVLCCLWVYSDQTAGYYFRYFSIGFLGAAFGLVPGIQLQKVLGHLGTISGIYLLLSAVLAFALKTSFLLYSLSVVITLAFLYALAMKMDEGEFVIRKIILVGKYTLISYLFQIVLLRMLKFAALGSDLRFGNLGRYDMLSAAIVTILLMWAFVEALNRLLQSSKQARRAYPMLFG